MYATLCMDIVVNPEKMYDEIADCINLDDVTLCDSSSGPWGNELTV